MLILIECCGSKAQWEIPRGSITRWSASGSLITLFFTDGTCEEFDLGFENKVAQFLLAMRQAYKLSQIENQKLTIETYVREEGNHDG